jgi:hypothetical protein
MEHIALLVLAGIGALYLIPVVLRFLAWVLVAILILVEKD